MCDPRAMPTPIDAADVRWYQRAVFYEVAVRGFFDSDGDGFGDFTGLTRKLDYLQWLGIDCLWLLPFYQSPLKDGGYDISDFVTVLPESGTVDDVAVFLDESHRRGIRVIADMVVNHTSDLHPWFQESRQDRINPKVAEAMLDAVRFWLGLGLDGFRLDAVPYLFERDGTTGENLPETHEYLRRIRKTVDAEFPNRVLLAEANQWPSDVVDYFGDGDECHMCFHFPLMPRMFMAVRKEQRHPITEILAQTPEIPDGTQWGIFLRNHDELTLEMVSDEDRDYMYSEYAADPRMKLNLGIRRRLFPLLDNDEGMAELFHAMLFSMPGSPVMYYGDEIGMGDNIYLGDRDGVRTPMQWSPDRNAGFSTADFAQLFLPPLMDPVYGYQAVNVEQQQRDSSSFLHWLRRMISVRRQHPVLAVGQLEMLHAQNPSVLAYLRRGLGDDGEEDIVLCVNNLSRFPQPCELMLEQLAGKVPIELTGRVPFPPIGELPYFVTLAGHGFYWFELVDHTLDEGGGPG